jgi:hypothetical protein
MPHLAVVVWSQDRNPFRRKTMSYLTTQHNSRVIVPVTERDWNKKSLERVLDWLVFGPFRRENFPGSPDGHKLYDVIHAGWREQVGKAKRQIHQGETAILDIGGFCRLSIEDLSRGSWGDHNIALTFTDFHGKPHRKHAEDFVMVLHDGHGGGCGIDFTRIESSHVLYRHHDRSSPGEPVDFSPSRIFRAITSCYKGILGVDGFCEQDLTDTLLRGDSHVLTTSLDIVVEVAIQGMTSVAVTRNIDSWQEWQAVPAVERDFSNNDRNAMRSKDIVLQIACTPNGAYDLGLHSTPWSGKSLYGFAQMLSNAIDITP